jgi:hypothetical protein
LEKNELRKKKLKKIVQKKIDLINEYLHKLFVRFYYNGLFLKMVGKFPKRNYKKARSSKSLMNMIDTFKQENCDIAKNNNNNEELNNKEIEIDNKENYIIKKKTKELNEYMKRLEKARGLRKLLSKRTKEKNEKLRKYFYKFYKAGILSKISSVRKQTNRYKQRHSMIDIYDSKIVKPDGRDEKFNFIKKSNSFMIKNEKKLKIKEKLQKIIFRLDRNNAKILKNIFEKYYLRSKIVSLGNEYNVIKKKKKKKKRKKENDNNNEHENEKDKDKEDAKIEDKEGNKEEEDDKDK